MSYWIAGAMVVASVAGTYTANQNAKKSQKLQEEAQNQAVQQAKKQEAAADQALNAANMKSPDVGGLLAAAAGGNRSGQTSTMLTGPSGIDPNKLKLGKTNLLGS
jgi:uncharacterized protein (UPF0333 family)